MKPNTEMDLNYLKKFRIIQVVSRLGFCDRAGLKADKFEIKVNREGMCVYTSKIHFSRKIYNKNIPLGFKFLKRCEK